MTPSIALQHLTSRVLAGVAVLAALSACATRPADGSAWAVGAEVTVEGRVVSVDRSPWAWDGDGLLVLATERHGEVVVHVPARTNLCRASGLDVFTTVAPGARIEATGEATTASDLTVCASPSHRLRSASAP